MIKNLARKTLIAESESDAAFPRGSYVRELAPLSEVVLKGDLAPANELSPQSEATPIANQVSAAREIVKTLVAAGVDTFFGIPGGPVSPVFDAILNTEGARLIESRHETSAVFSAADYYRASGKVPAVVVTAGPGATNAVTGIVSAHLERVPMLVISGDVAWAANGGKLLQDCGPEGIAIETMLGNVTRATVRIAQPRSAVSQTLSALAAATDPMKPGPALVVLPIQTGSGKIEPTRIERGQVTMSVPPPRGVVREVCQWLEEARRPLLVIGAGCRPYATRIRRLVDMLDIPFVTTPQGKGIVSELHPRSLRHGGLAASLWARRYTADGVDVALALGTDLDDCSVGPTPYIAPNGRLVHVDLDSSVFNRNHKTAMSVVADIGTFVDEMHSVASEVGLRNGRCSAVVREIRGSSAFDRGDFATDDSPIIAPHRAIADLEKAVPNARFITDIGEHMLFALHYLTAKGPDAFTIHLGLGSMGSGIAGAIGLALGDPNRRVVCVCGDGGMQMNGMEALVAVKERLPIVFAVFNDARYNMVFHGFKFVFGREAPWDSPFVDFAGWANAMGMPSMRVERPGDIDAAKLDQLCEARLPVILDIRIDRDVRIRGGGRNESLQHMSMLSSKSEGAKR